MNRNRVPGNRCLLCGKPVKQPIDLATCSWWGEDVYRKNAKFNKWLKWVGVVHDVCYYNPPPPPPDHQYAKL